MKPFHDPATHVVAVIDCTAFYVSCERVFDPRLRGRPVVVLSNNDGCVIARSPEVKALGIPMGAPYFKVRDALEAARAVVRSSNYALYADMSHRVMELLRTFSDEVEVYSIDEAFLRLPRLSPNALRDLGREMRERVLRWTGIPTHIGIGETKTLAKIADELSKAAGGVMCLAGHPELEALMRSVPIGDVWGVGFAHRQRLERHGVRDAWALRNVPVLWARRQMSVVGERMVRELQGIPCIPMEAVPPTRKGITRSRSFGEPILRLPDMERAVATYIVRAAEKARRFGLVPKVLSVFITTRHFGEGPHYSQSAGVSLSAPTAYTPTLIEIGLTLLHSIWRDGFRYRKAGVHLLELVPQETPQGLLFEPPAPAYAALMRATDTVNRRYGPGTVFFGKAAPSMKNRHEMWQMKQDQRSPRYTTHWGELLQAR